MSEDFTRVAKWTLNRAVELAQQRAKDKGTQDYGQPVMDVAELLAYAQACATLALVDLLSGNAGDETQEQGG